MFTKGKKLLIKVYKSIDALKLKGMPKIIILGYVLQLFLLVTFYILALVLDYYVHAKFDYTNALALLKVLISGEAVLALGITCKGIYDADNDGVPDIAEQQDLKGGDHHVM